ncbi:MAG: sugar transferase [Candidatus Paceibacterota bacterium]|jgi:lipopolysaccharide/colanic/teichoic acid biosynthesis glycosyltransferase
MKLTSKKETLVLLVGDIIFFCVALWLTLFVRNAEFPSWGLFSQLLTPFAFIFAIWLVVFYIADLYGKHTSIFRRKLPRVIFNSQLVNSFVAMGFFYFIPYFGVTPKTLLFVDLFISFFLIFAWRSLIAPKLSMNASEKIYFACAGQEVDEIKEEVKNNPYYNIKIAREEEMKDIKNSRITSIVVDLYDPDIDLALKNFYSMIFSGIRFIPLSNLYEELFDREPVLSLKEQWFLENISNRPKPVYDALKRLMDIAIAGTLGLVSLIFYPFVYLAIKLEDGGPLFISQERIGKDNKSVVTYKFRSMSNNVTDLNSENNKTNRVTRVGNFLRKTRIDEIPQLWGIVRGDMSLIGPRPELPSGVGYYSQEIPYYNIRHIIKPGLSGWAQIRQDAEPHHGLDVGGTSLKFSYDLYYIKNRNFWLDLSIALKTIKILMMRKGR